MGCKISEAG